MLFRFFPMPSSGGQGQSASADMKDILLGGEDEPFPMPSNARQGQSVSADMKDILLGGEDEAFPMPTGEVGERKKDSDMKGILLGGSGKSTDSVKDAILGEKSDGFPFGSGQERKANPLDEPFPLPSSAGQSQSASVDMKDILLGGEGEPFPKLSGDGQGQNSSSDMKDIFLSGQDESPLDENKTKSFKESVLNTESGTNLEELSDNPLEKRDFEDYLRKDDRYKK